MTVSQLFLPFQANTQFTIQVWHNKYYSPVPFSLLFSKSKENIVFLKRGKENQPFSLDLRTYSVDTASISDWENAPDILIAPYYSTGDFVNKVKELKNIYSKKLVRPSGDHILYFFSNVDGKYIFVYSFSGFLRKSKGIGFWITSSEKKIGTNYLEIWDTESQKIEFSFNKFSFSKSYRPKLLFWLESFRLIILSNNYNKSLIILKY